MHVSTVRDLSKLGDSSEKLKNKSKIFVRWFLSLFIFQPLFNLINWDYTTSQGLYMATFCRKFNRNKMKEFVTQNKGDPS